MIKEIITAVQGIAAGIKPALLLIPAVIAIVVLLSAFAKNSYKLFRIALPFIVALAGGYVGAGLLGSTVDAMLPGLGYWIAGIVSALVLTGICSKFHKLSMFVIGAAIGVLVVDGLVKGVLWKLDLVNNIAESVPGGREGTVVAIVGFVILAICTLVCAKLLAKRFKAIYTLLTSVVCMVVAAALPAILVLGSMEVVGEIAVIACAVIGLIAGIKAAVKQIKNA